MWLCRKRVYTGRKIGKLVYRCMCNFSRKVLRVDWSVKGRIDHLINVCVCSLSFFLKPNLIIPDDSLDMPISQRMVYRDGCVHYCRGKMLFFGVFQPINGEVMQTGLEKALTIGIWKWARSRNRCRLTKRFLAVCTHVCMRLCLCVIRSIFIAKNSEDTGGKRWSVGGGISFPISFIVVCSCACFVVYVWCSIIGMVSSLDQVDRTC